MKVFVEALRIGEGLEAAVAAVAAAGALNRCATGREGAPRLVPAWPACRTLLAIPASGPCTTAPPTPSAGPTPWRPTLCTPRCVRCGCRACASRAALPWPSSSGGTSGPRGQRGRASCGAAQPHNASGSSKSAFYPAK
jgi:hypothetical protein